MSVLQITKLLFLIYTQLLTNKNRSCLQSINPKNHVLTNVKYPPVP